MFSNEGCALDEDTLEYSWLVEIQLGKLSGKLTVPQVCRLFKKKTPNIDKFFSLKAC